MTFRCTSECGPQPQTIWANSFAVHVKVIFCSRLENENNKLDLWFLCYTFPSPSKIYYDFKETIF